MAKDDTPIIIKKVKKGHGGHHGGAWKVAYADFVTAMMAFFLVMWIVGLSKPMKQAIAAYFRDPSGFMKTSHGGVSPISDNSEKVRDTGKPGPIIPRDGGANILPGNEALLSALHAQFRLVQSAIKNDLEKNPEFKDLRDSVDIQLTDEGLRVELEEKTNSLFFDTGSAKLKEHTVHLLQKIAQQLGKLKSPVVIEGHTDSQPLNGPNGYSNWELSTDRANAARRIMDGSGLHPGQVIAVRGYADRKLLVRNNPMHFSNRRVSILVPYVGKNQ